MLGLTVDMHVSAYAIKLPQHGLKMFYKEKFFLGYINLLIAK